MNANPLLLEGELVEPSDHTAELRRLESRIDRLESLLPSLRAEAKRDAVVALLSLLHSSLRKIASGELDLSIADTAAPSAGNSRWDAIKSRNPGRISEAIDTLLAHGSMNASQLAAAMHIDRSNCSKNVIPKLSSMGLLVRNGRMLSLKDL